MIHLKWYKFSDLTVEQLYAVLAMRSAAFVVEQNCLYLDPDGKDVFAMHLLGEEDNFLVGYLRIFPPTEKINYIQFGRVLIANPARKKGHGKRLLKELLSYCDKNYPKMVIKCSAQLYLTKFYEAFGFRTVGEVYDEDGIPHINMEKG